MSWVSDEEPKAQLLTDVATLEVAAIVVTYKGRHCYIKLDANGNIPVGLLK